MSNFIKKLFIRNGNPEKNSTDTFLSQVSGVIHVGANTGQECDLYEQYGLNVLWIEPISAVFSELQERIRAYPRQRAVQALVTDVDGDEYSFNISNNGGASSSIYDFKLHKDIWGDVHYTDAILLRGITLVSLLDDVGIDPKIYQALIMDTQGSELLVLRGSLPLLNHFKFIKTEVPNFESYQGCCQLDDMEEFMHAHGFHEALREQFATHPDGGGYFDIVYSRN